MGAESPPAASPYSPQVVYTRSDGQLQTDGIDGFTRTYPLLTSEFPAAVAPGTAILAGGVTGIDQLDLATGTLTPVRARRLPGVTRDLRITRAGTKWLEGTVSTRTGEAPVIVNRQTGRIVDTDGSVTQTARSWGARRWIDLSRNQPDQHLCTPILRTNLARTGPPKYGALLQDGTWTLRETQRVPAHVTGTHFTPARYRWLLQRCATRTTVAIRPLTTPVFGAGFLAWVDAQAVHLRELSTGATRRYALPHDSTQPTTLALSTHELLVSSGGETPHAGFTIYRIALR